MNRNKDANAVECGWAIIIIVTFVNFDKWYLFKSFLVDIIIKNGKQNISEYYAAVRCVSQK